MVEDFCRPAEGGLLDIRLLGTLGVYRDGQRLPQFETRTARALFGFLVLHRDRRFPRLVLAEHFWAEVDEATARKRLRMELWRIRKTLQEGDAEETFQPLVAVRDEVSFQRLPGVSVDVDELEARLEKAEEGLDPLEPRLRPDQVTALRQAAELYQGELLEGEYGDWCSLPREQLRERFLGGQRHLLHHYQRQREWEPAISVGLCMLNVDSLQEDIYRELMTCYWQAGNRAAALQTFELCSKRLWQEMKVEPMDETVALYRRLRGDRGAPGDRPANPPPPSFPPPPRIEALVSVRGGSALGSPMVERTVEDLEALARMLEEARDRVRLAAANLAKDDAS